VDLIDLVDLKVIATLEGKVKRAKDRSVVGRFWSRDSRWIATVGSDHTVDIWDGDKGKPVSTLEGHTDWSLRVAFAPDGKTLVTASNDETARLWETATGKQLHVFTGHAAEKRWSRVILTRSFPSGMSRPERSLPWSRPTLTP
jgi:WD40 repeat protein